MYNFKYYEGLAQKNTWQHMPQVLLYLNGDDGVRLLQDW